jgi:hypothetical protein
MAALTSPSSKGVYLLNSGAISVGYTAISRMLTMHRNIHT